MMTDQTITDNRVNFKKIDVLMKEWEVGFEATKHWDLLRWNWSKFFLSIETIFAILAAKGLTLISFENYAGDKLLISKGLLIIILANIALCIIWGLRNYGIHTWGIAATKRIKEIENSEYFKDTLNFFSGIEQIMSYKEGRFFPIHWTGNIEALGPPIVFAVIWIGVFILGLDHYTF